MKINTNQRDSQNLLRSSIMKMKINTNQMDSQTRLRSPMMKMKINTNNLSSTYKPAIVDTYFLIPLISKVHKNSH